MYRNTPGNPSAAALARAQVVIDNSQYDELASRGARLVAYILDYAVIFGALGMVWVLQPFVHSVPNRDGEFTAPQIIVVVIALSPHIINLVLMARRSQTIGKFLLGIRIVRSDGQRAGFWRIFGLRSVVNYLIYFMPLIGWVYLVVDTLLIFRESRQCAHDQLADTIVVKT